MPKNKILKFVANLIAAFLLINLALTVYNLTTDQAALAAFVTPMSDVQSIGGQTGLNNFQIGQHPDAPVDYQYKGVGVLGSTAYFLMDLFKYLMSGIALIMITVIAIKLIAGGSSEETTTKAKKGLGVAVAGLVIIQLADVAVKKIFFGEHGEVLEDKTTAELFATEGKEEIRGIIGFVELALGAIAVLVIIINGVRIMASGTEEENRKKGLKNVAYAAGGLVLILLSELIVKGFVFPEQGSKMPSIGIGVSLFVIISNFIAGFIAVIAFVMLLYAGYIYVIAGGEDTSREKVKKLLLGAAIGILLALGAYAITNTLITFDEYAPVEVITEETP